MVVVRINCDPVSVWSLIIILILMSLTDSSAQKYGSTINTVISPWRMPVDVRLSGDSNKG